MPVTRAPRRPAKPAETSAVDEAQVQEVIRRGGSVAADLNPSALPEDEELDALKNVQLRLYESQIQEIDVIRKKQARGRRPLSRHAWLLQAIEEKLDRERQG